MKNATLKTLAAAAAIALSLFSSSTLLASAGFSPAATLSDAEQAAKKTAFFVAYNNNAYGESLPEEQRLDRLNRINREITRVCDIYSITLPKVTRMNVLDSNRGLYNPTRDEIVFSTNNMERTLRHEFGHVIDARLDVNNDEWKALVSSLETKYNFAPSSYARTSDAEYWAEAFAVYTSPNYGTTVTRFPAELESFIQKVLAKISTSGVMTASR